MPSSRSWDLQEQLEGTGWFTSMGPFLLGCPMTVLGFVKGCKSLVDCNVYVKEHFLGVRIIRSSYVRSMMRVCFLGNATCPSRYEQHGLSFRQAWIQVGCASCTQIHGETKEKK